MENLIEKLLTDRNINTKEEREEFLSDSPTLLHDPFLIPNIKELAERLLVVMKANKKICIYSDYDADGITGAVVLKKFLSEFTKNIIVFIPSRFEGGYGLHVDSIEEIKKENVDVILTCDLGVTNILEVERAKELGMEVLITDHHKPGDEIPNCIVANPHLKDSKYPFKNISGCFVSFKLCQAIHKMVPEKNLELILSDLIDLVAISTVTDVMPVLDENRTILKRGLKKIRQGTRKQISKILTVSGSDKEKIDTYKIGFIIGPHLNAAGRLQDATIAFNIFFENDESNMDTQIGALHQINNQRRDLQAKCLEEGIELVKKDKTQQNIIMILPESIHEGVAGIVAGKLKDIFYRPSIVLSKDEDILKASCRSIDGVNIIELLRNHEELFEKLGGHSMAAGFSIKESNFEELKRKLNEDILKLKETNPDVFIKQNKFDLEIPLSEITFSFVNTLNQFEPFGTGNERPVFKISNIVPRNIRVLGKNQNVIKFSMSRIELIHFLNTNENPYDVIKEGATYNMYGNLSINEFNGNQTLQFQIKSFELV